MSSLRLRRPALPKAKALGRLLIAWLAALLLAGCVTTDKPEGEAWRLKGKLSLKTSEGSRVVRLDWRRSTTGSNITLSGPLGLSVAKIVVTGTQVTVEAAGKKQSLEGEVLLPQKQGAPIRVPFQPLLAWFDNAFQAEAAEASHMADKTGHANPWQISVIRYKDGKPSLVSLSHTLIQLRLKVLSWA